MKDIKILCNNYTRFIFIRNLDMIRLRSTDSKINDLHRVRKENRFMYGPVKKKGKRALKDSMNTSQSNGMLTDSELWWNLKHCKRMVKLYDTDKYTTIKKIKNIKAHKKNDDANLLPKRNFKNIIVNRKENITNSSVTSKIIKEAETMHSEQGTEKKHDDTLETTDTMDKLKILPLASTKLLDVVINNIASFPISNPEKKLLQGKMDILSFSVKDEPSTLYYPSVTKILAATLSAESQKALQLWKDKLIAEMGEDKFNEYNQEQLNSGSLFHSCIENTLQGKSVDVPDNIQPAFDSLIHIVKELENVRAIESHVSHDHLKYKGKIDCVAVYKGELCAIDWKKSTKDKNSLALTYDAPVQLAAYIGAINHSKIYPFTVKSGLIVIGYTNGKPADTYVVKGNVLKSYWKKWLMKLQQYWTSISKKN